MKSSDSLEVLSTYSRKELQDLFNITDATINTGVFQPKGHSSIWLFVTKHKTPDRTAYDDDFDGKLLKFEGQLQGRTDNKIIHHISEGNELLVFYRDRKNEYPNYAFKYFGRFNYLSHSDDKPKRFVLQSMDLGKSVRL